MKLIRKQILLKAEKESVLDYNYYLDLQHILYDGVRASGSLADKFLHDVGFRVDNNCYKLFNYSLVINNAVFSKDGIAFNEHNRIILELSGEQEIVNMLLFGLIRLQSFNLRGVKFKVHSFEDNTSPKFNNVMLYSVRTPLVVSGRDTGNKTYYFSPMEERFYVGMANNLKRKYRVIYGEEYVGPLYFDIENLVDIKKKFITNIKKGYVIGYASFNIYLEADDKMQKVAYYCGLGEKSSMGMGMISCKSNRCS